GHSKSENMISRNGADSLPMRCPPLSYLSQFGAGCEEGSSMILESVLSILQPVMAVVTRAQPTAITASTRMYGSLLDRMGHHQFFFWGTNGLERFHAPSSLTRPGWSDNSRRRIV